MQYSTLLVAAAAFSGLVGAQNSSLTLPSGIQPCCTVSASAVPTDQKSAWCRAAQNTCPEICGGQGQIASGGNECSSDTLTHTCECRNGTKPDMSLYQQSVEGQMCRFWYSGCINATNQDATLQFNCDQTRNEMCGNKTSEASTSSSTTSGSGNSVTSRTSSGGSSATGTGSSSSSTPSSAARALEVAREYSTHLLAGGMAAVFGLVL
ncbi:hypothetical protein P280DRAFT_465556 [Massarina eburnea CBS 473.64]|uniref:DUF7707 domain-containing protein n=1 Tax=Massarina eburnea CBS 473.64 TaxID=1395130 RepID=A0A6A6SD45_9PLEO|nr:hypothetical protein P280DRAFT_465556 [Massarina eburnea CBS 473.64]